MQTGIDLYLDNLVRAWEKLGIPKSRLALNCNLHPNTLTLMGTKSWNPAVGTMRRLERFLFPGDDLSHPSVRDHDQIRNNAD